MEKTSRAAEPHFSQPVRALTMMLIVLALFMSGAYVAFPRVSAVFLSNVWLNGFILVVFVIGVLSCFLQVTQLFSSVIWIEGYAAERPGHQMTVAPRLLAPLAALLRSRGRRTQISPTSARSILDSVATRIDEAREITRYIVSLLIFLGLLGTFYGLATTVPAVVETIRSLAPADGEGSVMIFDRLMTGLESQLGGMGTAFSSSLLGLAGSLVVGLLELFAGQSQNRFYRELEEWLSTITRLGVAGGEGEGAGEASAVAQVVDQLAEQMAILQDMLAQSEAERARLDRQLAAVGAALDRLVGRLDAEASTTAALQRIAEGQERLVALLEKREAGGGDLGDAENRMRLRSIDVQLLRILEEISAGRLESIAEIRNDLAALNRSIRQLSRGSPAVGELKG